MAKDKQLIAFRKRWNIQLDDQQEFERFQHRIVAALDRALENNLASERLAKADDYFCFLVGKPRYARDYFWDILPDVTGYLEKTRIYETIIGSKDLVQVIEAIQAWFWALGYLFPQHLELVVAEIRRAIELSPMINLKLLRRGNIVTLYPAGAKELDEALVTDVLAWLERYPKIAKHFEEALRIYLVKDASKYRNLLDNLRFAVEQLLRSVLHNRKSLENQGKVLLPWLKERGVHQQIINMYQTLLSQFAQYQNDAVKHDEAFSPTELEFMIYLTGAFIRFILELQTASPST